MLFKVLAAIVLLISILNPALAQSPCENLLLSPNEIRTHFEKEYSGLLQGASGLKKVALKLKSRSVRRRILDRCKDGCTPEQLGILVKEAVQSTPGLQNAMGYGFVIGGMAINAAMIAEVTVKFNPQVHFIPTFVGSLLAQMSFVSANVLAPYLEPLTSRLRRSTFALTKGGTEKDPKPTRPTIELEPLADDINITYTLREQHVTDRILTYRNALKLNFEAVALALEKKASTEAVAELGDALMLGYRHFRDLSPSDPTILNAARTIFKNRVLNSKSLVPLVLDYLRQNDLGFREKTLRPGEITAQEYYSQALKAWLEE